MKNKDSFSLVTHLTPVISIFVDELQFVLIIRQSPTQRMKNGYHTYHRTLGRVFEEVLNHLTRFNLADGKNKSIEEIKKIMEDTIKESKELFKSFFVELPNIYPQEPA